MLDFHFYASMSTIIAIQTGREMFVHTKEGKVLNENIHVSLDTRYYDIKQVSDDTPNLFKVKKR